MILTKKERLAEVMNRVRAGAPYGSFAEVLAAFAEHVRSVENEFSGVPENPCAADARTTDGRMYPPDERFEIESHLPEVRAFKQRKHITEIAVCGAVRITGADGAAILDLAGRSGRTVLDYLASAKPGEVR